MSIRICGDNTVASPAITSASDTDTGLQFGTNEVKVVNGNLDITDGNLIVASGHGIDFSATGDSNGTMTSELLHDYEIGTWNPYIGGHSGDGSATYDEQHGGYQKIGDFVRVWGYLDLQNISSNPSGNARLKGFPFTPASNDMVNRSIGILSITNTSQGYVSCNCRGVFTETSGVGAALMFKTSTTANSFNESGATTVFGTNTKLYFHLHYRAAF